jgi:sulfur dioxygenase
MIFRQLFDPVSSTYTYLLAAHPGGEALIIDPVIEAVESYAEILGELDLRLVKALDTHLHADHVSGLGALRDRFNCITVMGAESTVDTVSMRVQDGDAIDIEGLELLAMYTPGHTDDSYCYALPDRVFTGDTLLIGGSGRTDFQGGNAALQYHSIFGKLLHLADDTLVFPGHDYNGRTVSTIAEERRQNPRLQVHSIEDYVALMDNLDLPDPKLMDTAVPANRSIGMGQQAGDRGLGVDDALILRSSTGVVLVDLREDGERALDGVIPDSLHVPYGGLARRLGPGGDLGELLAHEGRRVVFYCSYGERSALAVKMARECGFGAAYHIMGGMASWKGAEAPVIGAGGEEEGS